MSIRFLLLLSCLLILVISGCGGGEAPAPLAEAVGAGYVGDEACADCHEDLYFSYHQTGMGRAVSRFDPASAPERFDVNTVVYNPTFDFYYEAFVRGDTLFQREFRKDASGAVIYEQAYPAAWVIGSGNNTRSYLMNVNGHVTEMPLTWYVERQKWDLSPAYEQTNFRFDRPIGAECMTCHNGPSGYSDFTQGHYEEVALGITCERCHGPGAAHVEARLAGLGAEAGEADPHIVNPARLGRDLQLSVCQQCHLTGTEVLKPGERIDTFLPGTALSAHRAVFAPEEQLDDPASFGIASHALRLALSACFEQSEMTCTTCHDPHRPVAELGDDHFNAVCQSCHQPQEGEVVCSRDAAHSVEEAMTGNCVSCHLQQSGTSDIPHVTFTDHWIRRRLPPPKRPDDIERALSRPTPFTLVRVTEDNATPGNAALAELEEAIAYFTFYEERHRLPAYLPKVVAQARRGLAQGAEHRAARLVLGRALAEQDSLDAALEVLAGAARLYPEDAEMLYWQGVLHLRAGQAAEAVAPLEKAVAVQPRFVEARLKLGEAYQQAGRAAEAEAAYRAALADDPAHHAAGWNNLGFLYLQSQRFDEAADAFDHALARDPDLLTALANAGTLRLVQQDFAGAATFFERALAVEPTYVPALGNLAVAYGQLGRYDEGLKAAERLLRLTPDDGRARAVYQELLRLSKSE